MTAGPLSRFTVLDLTRVRAGPTCVRYFADWGANCIKIELPPGSGEDMGGPRFAENPANLQQTPARPGPLAGPSPPPPPRLSQNILPTCRENK